MLTYFGNPNLIYAVGDSGDGKRIGLCSVIDFSKVCTKSESAVMFWEQDAWGTPVTLTFLLLCHFPTCIGLLCQVILSSWDLLCMDVV